MLSQDERDRLLALGPDLAAVWHAATTTPRDRKELLRALLEEVIVKVERDKAAAHLTLRWKGGALNEIDLALPRSRPATIRTDEDTIALVRRLAVHYPDTVIAGILNRQGRTTAYGHRFEAGRVGNLRRHWDIPCFEAGPSSTKGELASIKKAAVVLGVAPSTLHRWLNDGIIPGEQLTPGAPWRIRLTDDLIARFSDDCWGRLRDHARGNPQARRLAPNRVAACQARRARSRARHEWQEKGNPDQGDNPAIRTLRSNLMNQGAL